MIRGVILDYGSTLIAFEGNLEEARGRAHQALWESLRGEGLDLREEKFLRRFERKYDAYDRRRMIDHKETTAYTVLRETLREEKVAPQPEEKLRRALRAMYEIYESHWKPYPESIPAIEKIRAAGLRLAMCSNAGDADNVRRMLASHKLESYFDPVVISAAIGVRKPDPRVFQKILNAWKIPASEIVMVGDQLGADILGGKQVGMRTIWLTTEENSPANKKLRGKVLPDAQVKDIGEAAALILHWKEQGS
jgi:putative hydrolase of the HAD superfamily